MIVGIAGGIGAGKSVATDYLRSKGYAVIDADEVAREAVMPGEPALAKLVREFGGGILKPDGSLDRPALAALAFADESGTKKLNRIMLGDIVNRIKLQLTDCDISPNRQCGLPRPIVFISAPLLFECGIDSLCDEVWLISAPEDIRVTRAALRDGAGKGEVRARAAGQLPEAERASRADRVIENKGSKSDLFAELDRLLGELGFGDMVCGAKGASCRP